jgi:hypothetical protein
MIHAQGRLDIRTGGEGVVFQIGNIKASRHLSFNDVNISTFPNKFSEKACWDLKCESLNSTLDVLECKRMMLVILF